MNSSSIFYMYSIFLKYCYIEARLLHYVVTLKCSVLLNYINI